MAASVSVDFPINIFFLMFQRVVVREWAVPVDTPVVERRKRSTCQYQMNQGKTFNVHNVYVEQLVYIHNYDLVCSNFKIGVGNKFLLCIYL